MTSTAEYQREFRRDRKNKAISQLGGKCIECGSTENLEFDHMDPSTKIANITQLLDQNFKKLQEELSKCQLLCHDCHLDKTYREQGKLIYTCGTTTKYRRGCRCTKCAQAANDYNQRRLMGKRREINAE